MRIDVLPAQNGDCILVEYAPNKYILVDGGYVDTYRKKNYTLTVNERYRAQLVLQDKQNTKIEK